MNTASPAILIIDAQGEIAPLLVTSLKEVTSGVIWMGSGGVPLKKIPRIPMATYSHIFVVYSKEIERLDIISQLIQKAQTDKAKLIFICARGAADRTAIETIKNEYKNSFFVLCGEIFDDNLAEVKKARKIKISHWGIGKRYPVFQDDIQRWLLAIAFQEQQNRIFFLFPKHPPTELTIARLIHKIDPIVGIDFNPNSKNAASEEKARNKDMEGEYVLGEKYPSQEDVKKAYQKITETKKLVLSKHKKENTSPRPYFFHVVSFIVALFFLPMLTTILFGFVGVYMLNQAKNNLHTGNIIAAEKSTKYSYMTLVIAQNAAKIVQAEAGIIGKSEIVASSLSTIETGKDLSEALGYIIDASKLFSNIAQNKSINAKEDIVQSIHLTKSAISIFQKARAESDPVKTEERELFDNMKSFNTTIDLLSNAIDTMPAILGFDKEKIYLVLFQNNMELRPGGGFIGSYGLLKVKSGRVEDFSIHDVYDADGQLKGHIEPPYPIRKYLPSAHWYLRDSNFNVDFAKGASTAAYFLKLETGKDVDGVIGVDISFVEQILKAVGRIYVADYNETVTHENVYILTQSHVEKNNFAGSSQKRDFLRSLFTSLRQHFMENNNISYIALLKSIDEALVEKHILFSFADPRLQNIFSVNGVSSVLWDNRVESTTKINDFLGINEANLGMNKANYFVKRKITQITTIESASVSSKLSIEYKNESASWPGGDYKNYLRILVPLGSTLSSVVIDGEEQKITKAITDPLVYEGKRFIPPVELEIEQAQEAGKTAFGLLVVIPAQKTKKITVFYSFPHSVKQESTFTYNHKIFKQPGSSSDPYAFSLSFPSHLRVINATDKIKKEDRSLKWVHNFSRDKDLIVHFSRE